MNQLEQIFNYNQQKVKVVLIDDQPWFVAKDVCATLEHSDSRKAVGRLDDDEKLIGTIFLSGQNRETWLINESGLYSLVLTSRKPEAKSFKRWVTHSVLPSIRKKGAYSLHTEHNLPMTYKDALLELVSKIDENEQLQVTITEQKPKVELYENLMSANGYQNMSQLAKSLGWGRNRLYAFLRDEGILLKDERWNLPQQCYVDQGYFKVIDISFWTPDGYQIAQQTLITPKGIEFIMKLLKKNQFETQYLQGVKETIKAGAYDGLE